MSQQNLEQVLQAAKSPVDLLRNSQIGAYVYPVVPTEFTQLARRAARLARDGGAVRPVASHGGTLVDGSRRPQDAVASRDQQLREVSGRTAPSSSRPCSYDGYVIGDVIMFHLAENELNLVGRAPTVNWVQFHARDRRIQRRGAHATTGRRRTRGQGGRSAQHYRYQMQGPNAEQCSKAERRSDSATSSSSTWTRSTSRAGRCARCATAWPARPGLEIWGPYEEREEIREAILEAGKDFGLVQVGSRAYATNTLESGWIPSPLPAVYTGEKMKKYREWLPANGYEATGSLGGSFVSNNIEDYYVTPVRARLRIVREVRPRLHRPRGAREDGQGQPQRQKVTFVWNGEDVRQVIAVACSSPAPSTTSTSTCRCPTTPPPRSTRS